MKKNETVKDNRYFNKIIANNKFIKNKYFVIYIMKKDEPKPFFGLAVGKKLGNAVVRNKFKRQLRVMIDKNKFLFPNNQDYIIMIRTTCVGLDFCELSHNFENLLKELVK